jgi:hypothetical protein
VAAKHYLQITDDPWDRDRSPTGSPFDDNPEPSVPIMETKKPGKTGFLMACDVCVPVA